jgi:nucleoside-diphosphate-sugar epimerase
VKKARILITGYGGFLGSAICKILLNNGYEVHGLARGDYPQLQSLGVVTYRGDAADESIAAAAIRGCDAVIHTAALAGVSVFAKSFEHANVQVTKTVLDAAIEAKLTAFVFCSSPSVVFAGRSQKYIDEREPYPETFLAHYPRTKAISEQLVLQSSNKIAACALRPHLVWGSGDNHLIPRLVDRAKKGRLRIIGTGENIIDTVHVDYAAQAHVDALEVLLERPQTINGRAFFITDDEPVKCWDWISQILRQFNLSSPTKSISVNSAYRIGHLMEMIYRVSRIKLEPPMTRFVALQMGLDHYYNISAAKELLGYRPIDDRDARIKEIG